MLSKKDGNNSSVIYKRFDGDFWKGWDDLPIVGLGDIHCGAKGSRLDMVQDQIDYIKSNHRYQVIGMGDYMECGGRYNLSDVFAQDSPQYQLEYIVEMLEPIKDRIWGLLDGNHEDRVYRNFGIRPTKIMAKMLGVKYLGIGTYFQVSLGSYGKSRIYTIYATHGHSGAGTAAGRLNACKRMGRFRDIDIYMMGHVHDVQGYFEPYWTVDTRSRKLIERKRLYVLTGHFLEYHGTYQEAKCKIPGKMGVAKIKLFKKRWDIHVSI